MPRARAPYTPEFRRRMVDPVRAGRDPDDLAAGSSRRPSAIRTWAVQADRQEGRREEAVAGLAAAERDELVRLRRENRQLRTERDILSEAMTGTHHTCATGPGPGSHARTRRVRGWLRRLAAPCALCPRHRRHDPAEAHPHGARQLRASSPPWKPSCSAAGSSRLRPRPGWSASAPSKAGTTRCSCTRAWAIAPP